MAGSVVLSFTALLIGGIVAIGRSPLDNAAKAQRTVTQADASSAKTKEWVIDISTQRGDEKGLADVLDRHNLQGIDVTLTMASNGGGEVSGSVHGQSPHNALKEIRVRITTRLWVRDYDVPVNAQPRKTVTFHIFVGDPNLAVIRFEVVRAVYVPVE